MAFKDKQTQRDWHNNYYHKRIKELKEIKGNKCEFCGWNDVVEVLEFAHIFGKPKSIEITKVLQVGKDAIMKELENCYLLCPNCHNVYDWKNGKRRR